MVLIFPEHSQRLEPFTARHHQKIQSAEEPATSFADIVRGTSNMETLTHAQCNNVPGRNIVSNQDQDQDMLKFYWISVNDMTMGIFRLDIETGISH